MTRTNPIIFLQVPESLQGTMERAEHHPHHHEGEDDFVLDPSIPLPVELPNEEEHFYREGMNPLEDLSWEMIVSGMMRILGNPETPSYHMDAQGLGKEKVEEIPPEWLSYYRNLVLQLRPHILEEFSQAAILKSRNGDYGMALEILSALEGIFPGQPWVLLNRALVLEARSDALSRLEESQGEGLGSGGKGAKARRGKVSEAEEAVKRADEAYDRLLDLEPPFPNGLFNAGIYYMKKRDFLKARETLEAYVLFADDEDKRERAEEFIREIDSQGLDDLNYQEAYGLIKGGQEAAGMEKIKLFIEENPKVWNGWFILGWALRKLGRWEDGEAAFRQALELGGDNADTRNELAICLMEMGDLAGARRELEQALLEQSENVKIISNLGVLALRQGLDDEAAAFFRTVLEIEPRDPIARAYLKS